MEGERVGRWDQGGIWPGKRVGVIVLWARKCFYFLLPIKAGQPSPLDLVDPQAVGWLDRALGVVISAAFLLGTSLATEGSFSGPLVAAPVLQIIVF